MITLTLWFRLPLTKKLTCINLMDMCKNDITFISVMLATYNRYIRNEYRDGRLAKGQYYARINRITDVANNIIKSL